MEKFKARAEVDRALRAADLRRLLTRARTQEPGSLAPGNAGMRKKK